MAHLQTRDVPLISNTQTEQETVREGVRGHRREGGREGENKQREPI